MANETFTAVAEKPRLIYVAPDGSFGYAEGLLLLDTADLDGGPEAYRKALDSGDTGDLYQWAANALRPGVELVSHEFKASGYILTTTNLDDIDLLMGERGLTSTRVDGDLLAAADAAAVASSLAVLPPPRSGWATIREWLRG